METSTEVRPARQSGGKRLKFAVTAIVLGCSVLAGSVPLAQQPTLHLNPVIARLAAGKVSYGLNVSNFSVATAREVARSPADWVYADMEHNPMDLVALQHFLMGMIDKAAIVKKGNLQPNVALMARFPPEAESSEWVVKQALDMGLMGIIFNGVSTKEHALAAVKSMRYPPMRTSKYKDPVGTRGNGPGIATWVWGLTGPEYMQHADLWPLNPDGDLFAAMLIENVEGVKNVDQIAAVPGVGSLMVGAGADLSLSLGVPNTSPEVEEAFQQVLKACKAHKVACGISANDGPEVLKRIKEGWTFIRSTVPGITAARAALGDK